MMTNVEKLCEAWIEAKRAETIANAQRIAIEKELSEALDVPTEGSKTHKLDHFKVTVTQPVSRKLDVKKWDGVKSKIPTNLHPVKTKIEADATGCKYLFANDPEMWAQIAEAFETKPGKIGIKVEAV